MIIVTNGTVITRDPKLPLIEGGAVAIEGAKIAAVGTAAEITAKYPGAEKLDAKGRLVMPGFINCHQHYYSTFARGMNLGGPPSTTFGDILRSLWWRLDRALTLEDVYYSAVGPMIDQIRAGVTTAIDHHAGAGSVEGSLFKIAEAAALFGIRSNLCYEVSDRDGPAIAAAGIRENAGFAAHCAKKDDDMLRALFGLHASLTVGDATLDKCLAAAQNAGVGFHVHCAEGIEDLVDSTAKYGQRVIERWVKRGVLNEKSLAVHCIQVTDDELDLLAASKTAVVHNPQSNMGNAVGVTPVLGMMKRGITLGLGTDGYTHDILESYTAAGPLQKLNARLPCVGWGEPPAMLFANNRAIVERHISGTVGILQAGAYADLIVVGYHAPTPLTAANIDSHLLFGVTGRHVDTTIINGRVVMKERVLQGIDEEALMAKSREQAAKFWKRI
jgi:putative selenium metabolism protein SsnA